MHAENFKKSPRASYEDIEPFEAAKLEDVRIIDVREPIEFNDELGHIPGAELVPLKTLQWAMTQWPKNQELLVVCRSGGRSSSAARMLAGAGFAKVSNLNGGMSAYNRAGLPVER
jgi:rhodanese-related sulfurtransferase